MHQVLASEKMDVLIYGFVINPIQKLIVMCSGICPTTTQNIVLVKNHIGNL